jgi:hypothetical protein
MSTLIAEINALNATFARLGIDAHASPQHTIASDTGNFVRYRISTPGKYNKITTLTDELADAISDARGQLVDIQFVRPLAIQVPHPAPVPLAWELAPTDLAPGQFSPGRNYSNGTPRPVVLDLADAATPHLMVATTTGGGKSTLLAGMILTLARSTPADQLQIYLIDPKPAVDPDLRLLAPLPHIAQLLHDPQEAVDLLQRMVAELAAREDPTRPLAPRPSPLARRRRRYPSHRRSRQRL